MHLSYPLIRTAFSDLELSLRDRCEQVFRSEDNHYSFHTPGSIVLLVTGFDSLLNELIAHYGQGLKRIADQSFDTKYYAIPKRFTGKKLTRNGDLSLLGDVRDEIVHHLPRPINEPDAVPSWFQPLQQRGLFITHPNLFGSNFSLGWKIGSYRLCYWAWETILAATTELLKALDKARPVVDMTVCTMEQFRKVCPPEKLGTFDKEHRLKLTEWK